MTQLAKAKIGHVPRLIDCGDGMLLMEPVASHFDRNLRAPHIEQMITALEEIHRIGLVHRDVRPENILRVSDSEVLVNDCGYATRFGELVQYRGTFHFASDNVLTSLVKGKKEHISTPEVLFQPSVTCKG